MSFRRILLCAIAALGLPFQQSASALPCGNLSAAEKHLHTTHYQHSLFAEMAYGCPPSNTCVGKNDKLLLKTPNYTSQPLNLSDANNRWLPEFSERWRRDQQPPSAPGQYVGDNGVTYLTCSYDNFDPQFALTWATTTFDALGPDQTPVSVTLFNPSILVVASAGLIPQDEEMGVIRLSRAPPAEGGQPDELVGFQGTDITRIPQLMSSLNDLMSNSCVFEMAAIVSSVVSSGMCEGQYSVVGHSLGGVAVQHVVRDFVTHPHRDPSLRSKELAPCNKVEFVGHAFNSIGIDHNAAINIGQGNLYSYSVDGEIISWLGRRWNRSQIGTTLKYTPTSSWPEIGIFELVDNVITGDQPETLRRHRLPAVQQALCECINGVGMID